MQFLPLTGASTAHQRKSTPDMRFLDGGLGPSKMSGLVAKRLFEFLPPRMPIATKLELAEKVWHHFGTSSSRHYTVGPNADPHIVIEKIRETLTKVIQDYNIPENVKNRFDWLASGDVSVKEHLLNYFRQMDKKITTDSLNEQLPVLQAQMRNYSGHTGSIHTKIQIYKHSVQNLDRPAARRGFSGRTARAKGIDQQQHVRNDLVPDRGRHRHRRRNPPVTSLARWRSTCRHRKAGWLLPLAEIYPHVGCAVVARGDPP